MRFSFVLYSLLVLIQIVFPSIIYSQDTIPSQIIEEVVFVANKIYEPTSLKITNRDFKRLAASFDDPSRILMHYPGFSNANDQANGIIYHGLPSHFSGWQLNGLEIVNPNHLSNAGTFSDLNSISAGGVNMFSGNLINSYEYNGALSSEKKGASIAGISNIIIDSLEKNYGQISLLGLETGLNLKKNKHHLFANYRYSFTGLLGEFGINFGNEKISFRDGLIGYNYITNKTKFTLLYSNGQSSNFHNKSLDSLTTIKDYFDIDYQSKINIIQLGISRKLSNKSFFEFGSSYSTKSDSRVAKARLGSIFIFIDEVNDIYSSDFSKVTLLQTLKIKGLFNIGIKEFYDFNEVKFSSINLENYSFNKKNWSLLPFIEKQINWQNLSADIDMSGIIDQAFYFTPHVKLTYRLNNLNKVMLGFSSTAQLINPFDADNKYSTSLNSSANYIFNYGTFNFNVEVFRHEIEGIPASFNLYNTVNLFDYSNLTNINNRGFVRSRGVSFNINKTFSNGLWLNTNSTFFKAEYSNNKINWFNTTNNFKTIYNLNIGKLFTFKNAELNISSSFHHRGGSYQYPNLSSYRTEFDYSYYPIIRLGSYNRIDLRVNYIKGKSFWSLDIQNLFNTLNDGYQYHDLNGTTTQKQLGMIPVLTYKYSF